MGAGLKPTALPLPQGVRVTTFPFIGGETESQESKSKEEEKQGPNSGDAAETPQTLSERCRGQQPLLDPGKPAWKIFMMMMAIPGGPLRETERTTGLGGRGG